MSNVYLNIKIRSLIHTTPFTTNYPWEISIVYLTMSNPIQSIIAKTCNSIIQTILLIIIILYTILCKIISFENYTCTYCGLFNHTIQHQYCPNLKKKHQYCGLFGHTIQHMKVRFTEENIYPNASFLKFCSACMPQASKNNSHRKWARKYFRYEVYQLSCTRFLVYLGIYRRMILIFIVHWITLKRMVC